MSNTPTIPETPEAKASADKKLTPKDWAIVAGNVALAVTAFVFFVRKDISEEFFGLMLIATGFPSVAGVIAKKLRGGAANDGGATAFLLFSLATMSVGASAIGCAAFASTERANRYFQELADCNADASTKRQSIECENEVRKRFPLPDGAPRPLRDAGAAF